MSSNQKRDVKILANKRTKSYNYKKYMEIISYYECQILDANDPKNFSDFNKWGLALLRLVKIGTLKVLMKNFKKFDDTSKNINDSETLLIKGVLYFIFRKDENEVKDLFEKSEMSILRILTFLEEDDEERMINKTNILHLLLDSEHKDGKFFQEITKKVKLKQKNDYKDVYIKSIFIISRLHVKYEEEELVAQYREKNVSQKLLFKDDFKFRLNAIDYSNDPYEGKTLLEFLYGKEKRPSDENLINEEYEAFAGCFVFDHDNLNMFRLYGKNGDDNNEGTGYFLQQKCGYGY